MEELDEEWTEKFIGKFKQIPIGHSIFIPDVERKDLEFLRRPIRRAGMNCSIWTSNPDPVHKTAGARIRRRPDLKEDQEL